MTKREGVTCPRCGRTQPKFTPAGRVWLESGAAYCSTCQRDMRKGI